MILVIVRNKIHGYLLTRHLARFENNKSQAVDVKEEKQTNYNPTNDYYEEKYGIKKNLSSACFRVPERLFQVFAEFWPDKRFYKPNPS